MKNLLKTLRNYPGVIARRPQADEAISTGSIPLRLPRRFAPRNDNFSSRTWVVTTLLVLTFALGSSTLHANDFWSYWGDGKAELSGYTLKQNRYGEPREGKAVLIFVTEDHSEKDRVKIEGDTSNIPASQKFSVFKLNFKRSFQTGIYDYQILSSVFARVDKNFEISKVSLSVQEWCGHVYHQLVNDGTMVREVLHSYFGGEADQATRRPLPIGTVFEDNIPILIRELRDPWLKPGQTIEAPCVPSLLSLRFRHKDFEINTVSITKSEFPKKIKTALGEINAIEWLVKTPFSGTFTYAVEEALPHRILKWSSDQGEEATLTGTTRLPYWALNHNGDEKHLKTLFH